jgi:hypothetical protein
MRRERSRRFMIEELEDEPNHYRVIFKAKNGRRLSAFCPGWPGLSRLREIRKAYLGA